MKSATTKKRIKICIKQNDYDDPYIDNNRNGTSKGPTLAHTNIYQIDEEKKSY